MQHFIDGGYDMNNTTRGARPHPPTLNERVGVDPWWWSLEEDRILTLPSSIIRFPSPRMQLVVLRNDPSFRSRPREQSRGANSGLTLNEQRKAFEKLKKEIYNPIPKKIIQRLGKFYRQKDATGSSGGQKTKKEVVEDDDEDTKKCVVCLEGFEAKTVVMVTSCNHMFHEDCIVPWVKSHGRCPVCRFSFCEEKYGASSTSINDTLTNDLISFVSSGGHFTMTTLPFWF